MKRKYLHYFILALLVGVTVSSCLDSNDEEYQQYLAEVEAHNQKVYEQYLNDSTLIAEYLLTNDSVAYFDSLYGIFYNILDSGTVYHPDLNSLVTVQYKGMLLDSTVFDQTEEDETAQFFLANLIPGWQIGLQKIGSGGKIILYLPSVYGYGETELTSVPANSVLIFDVDLVSFY